MYGLSIILPFIDELNSLTKTINIINKQNKENKEFLIIISSKKTPIKIFKKLKKLKTKKNVKIFYQKEPFVGGAVKKGIKISKKSHIVIMASDLETDPNDLKKMIKLSKKNQKKIVCASRWHIGGKIKNYGLIKKIFNFLFQILSRFILKTNLSDFTFAYRIYPSKALKENKFYENKHSFALEMIIKPIKKGYKTLNVPATWAARIEGTSQNSILNYFGYFKILFKNII
tara:strand:+ start:1167 stop:1853 length:687 start_codon:yes stop_codon:yes gene_type:complete